MHYFLRVLCCFLLVSQTNLLTGMELSQGVVSTSGQPILEDGTPVKLRIAQTVSSADAHVDDKVEFEVLEEVRVSDILVIPKGGIAWGTVTEAQPKRRMARGGKLEIVMDSVRLVDGQKAAIRRHRTDDEIAEPGHEGVERIPVRGEDHRREHVKRRFPELGVEGIPHGAVGRHLPEARHARAAARVGESFIHRSPQSGC